MSERLKRFFIALALAILGITGALKLAGIFHAVPLWDTMDPLFGLSRRWVIAGASLFEIACCALALRQREPADRIPFIVTPFLAFLLYRLGLAVLGANDPCPCLGGAESWWPWLEKHSRGFTKALFVTYGGSVGLAYALQHFSAVTPENPKPILQ